MEDPDRVARTEKGTWPSKRQLTVSVAVIAFLLFALLLALTNPTKDDFVEYVLSDSGVAGLPSDDIQTNVLRTMIAKVTARSDYGVLSTYRFGSTYSEVTFVGFLGQFLKVRGDFLPSSLVIPSPVRVEVRTNQGAFTIQAYQDLMPMTVANFLRLAKSGFYDGLPFHRVEDWVVQGGDPKGDGTGGPGWTIDFETSPQLTHKRGAVGMARRADDLNSAGSQFYIVKSDARSLDGSYAVFGRVIEGMEIVDRLRQGDEIVSVVVVAR